MQERRSRRGGLVAVRRRRKIRRFLRSYGNYIAAVALFLVAVSGAVVLAAGLTAGSEAEAGNQPEVTEALQQTAAAVIETPQPPAEPQEEAVPYPFNTMSQDWSGEDLQGWKPYTVPEEYQRTGGAFPEAMQKYTYIICSQSGVDYAVVLALIEAESGYKWDAEGKKTDTGYIQIVQKWHEDRMERLNAGDLRNPFQNVRVGVDYLEELLERYGGSYEKALTAYQYGARGADELFFSEGRECSPYAKDVLAAADRIRTEMDCRNGGGQDDVR